MSSPNKGLHHTENARQAFALFMRRAGRVFDRGWRRLIGRRRKIEEEENLLPLLVQVLAAFAKSEGEIDEEEIDSALGFLRHDNPEAVYSELRRQFREALGQQQDVNAMGERLGQSLSSDRKVLLTVQLYDLISKTGYNTQTNMFHGFMERLGMGKQAIEIVHQLQSGDATGRAVAESGESLLEVLTFGKDASADVWLQGMQPGERLLAFRYQDMILLKNQTSHTVFVRGRPLASGAFRRVYAGQRVVLDEQVLTFQDLAYYFNAKKNIAVTQIYISINDDDEVEISRVKGRDSALEVRFGLKVQVRALRDVDALLNGIGLRQGSMLNATLEDRIIFHTDAELSLGDLRRRARALGARFNLKSSKSVYHVSNDAGLLDVDDILLSPGTSGDVLLKILCDYENRVGKLEIERADRAIGVGDKWLTTGNTCDLRDGDIIRIDAGQGLRCDFSERIIEEERNIVSSLELQDLTCMFEGRISALDNLSFSVNRGEMVCVMGGSGSGKSTLLRAIAGRLHPSRGTVLLNGQPLYDNLSDLQRFIAFVPQDDAFDDHLTVEENLRYAAAIRSPHLSERDRTRRIDSRLIELGLAERRDVLVGSYEKKTLSGGERKRLNIGLDMISSADIFLFDEPTSGLSSKDSEHVIDIIRSLAHNKIVLVVIHQPSARIFNMFSKAMLLDRGGKMVFYGPPNEMLSYFKEAANEERVNLGANVEAGHAEFVFDVMETPLHDLSGDILYEEGVNGQLLPARRFSPDFWRDRYESYRLLQEMRQVSVRKQSLPSHPPAPVVETPKPTGAAAITTALPPIRWREEWLQFRTLLRRAFLSKLRNVASLVITLLAPPAMAAIVGWALYFTDEADRKYVFASAFHIPTYIFIALLVALFLALMNSVEDIIRDRTVLQRERNLGVRISYYVIAKFITLCVFSALQCALFVAVGNSILEIRGMFSVYFLWTFITAVSGLSLGLLVSALVPNSKTGAMLVPLILIPQLIFGGALIKYEEMNRDAGLLYTFQRYFAANQESTDMETDKKLQVPFISRLTATHYSYEALVVAQAKINPLTTRLDTLALKSKMLAGKQNPTDLDEQRLDDLKDTMAQLSGLETGSPREIDRRLQRVDKIIDGDALTRGDFNTKVYGTTVRQLYANQKIADMVDKAESEQNDYRRAYKINVFFSPEKIYLGWAKWTPKYYSFSERKWLPGVYNFDLSFTISVYTRNAGILLGSSLILLLLLRTVLKRQLQR